ncbi:hypothetical protein BH20ACT22_BH20ACT22_13010 [soil metagenome]
MMKGMRSETGVAMVTVLLVGAVMTVVSSGAAYVTIREFQSGQNDRKASEALAFAESGVDRLLLELRRNPDLNWNRVSEAGCKYEPVALPKGNLGAQRSYRAYLTVYQPDFSGAARLPDLHTWTKAGDAWDPAWNDGEPLCTDTTRPGPLPGGPQVPQYFAITATGEHPTATRVVRQVVKIGARGMPIGLYAESVNVQGGNPTGTNISLVTPGDVNSRENLNFSGTDPYYKLGDFWDGQSMSVAAPAAVHARGSIYCRKQDCGNDTLEHPEALNCAFNNGQSQWDQSSGGGSLTGLSKCPAWSGTPAGPPPYSSFSDADLANATPKPALTAQDYANLKESAKATGLYCAVGASYACTTPSGPYSTNGTIQSVPGVGNNYVAYFDFPSSGDPFSSERLVTWKAAVGPCSLDATLTKSVIIVVRYGSLDLTGKDLIVGAFFAPEGQIWMRGSGGIVKIEGTAIAKRFDFGGNAQITLTDCWVKNLPGVGFLSVTPQTFSEVDR